MHAAPSPRRWSRRARTAGPVTASRNPICWRKSIPPAQVAGPGILMESVSSLGVISYFRIGENRRPRRQPRSLAVGELPRAARLGVHYPQLLFAAPRRCEDQVPPVGRPRWILILTFARELLRNAIPQVDHPDLEISILLLVRDRAAVR